VNITTIGRGTIAAGSLVRSKPGNKVTLLGARRVVMPRTRTSCSRGASGSISDALGRVTGLEGKLRVDATRITGRESGTVARSRGQGANRKAVAKAFNANAGVLFDRVGDQRVRPGCCTRPTTRRTTSRQQLIRDSGLRAENLGGLESAACTRGLRFPVCSSSSRRPFTGLPLRVSSIRPG